MEIPVQNLDNELLQRIAEISSQVDRIERAVDALIQHHGDRSETVDSARAVHVSLMALKRELFQHYLEYCNRRRGGGAKPYVDARVKDTR